MTYFASIYIIKYPQQHLKVDCKQIKSEKRKEG